MEYKGVQSILQVYIYIYIYRWEPVLLVHVPVPTIYRYRHPKSKRHPPTTPVKMLINPDVYIDDVLDSNDTTVLIK